MSRVLPRGAVRRVARPGAAAAAFACAALLVISCADTPSKPEQRDAPPAFRSAAVGTLEESAAAVARLEEVGADLAPGRADRFELRADGRIRPVMSPDASVKPAVVLMPSALSGCATAAADESVYLQDRSSGLHVRFALVAAAPAATRGDGADAEPSEAQAAEGLLLYPAAGPSGADVIHRPLPTGTEDFVTFDRQPAVEQLDYRIDVAAVAGLRFVNGVVEFLDDGGAPRLRMGPAYWIDRAGTRRPATVSVDDCDYDPDPRAPWGRPAVSPGRDWCSLRVSWRGDPDDYPAIVDPPWITTGTMAETHYRHTAALLASGRVLVVAGGNSAAELYDRATETWAMTGALASARGSHSGARLHDGRVLAVGGGTLPTAEIYDPSTGFWSPTGSMSVGRRYHGGALLLDGRYLVTGGSGGPTTAEIYDPATGAWSATGSMTIGRSEHTATLLGDGTVLVAGGSNVSTTAERYDPTAGTFATTGDMSALRFEHVAARLADGTVLVTGGWVSTNSSATAERYDPATGLWSPAPAMHDPRAQHDGVLLPSGQLLVVGGWGTSYELATTERFLPLEDAWIRSGSMFSERAHTSLTVLPSDEVLVPGGTNIIFDDMALCELLALEVDGSACSTAATCASGFCVDGVCCDARCDGLCEACSAAAKGTGVDGVCEPVGAGRDPHDDCSDQEPTSCSHDGSCDGFGACADYAAGTACDRSSCAGGQLTEWQCDGSGHCTSAVSSCAPYLCADVTACSTACGADVECAPSGWCRTTDHTCQPDQPDGAPCSSAAHCQSGFCVDDVCCNEACTGTCRACSATAKGGGSDGLCGLVAAGVDPHGDCPDDGASTCQRDGLCDGAGACRLYPAGSTCAPGACAGDVLTPNTCTGTGTCTTGAAVDCTPYRCIGGACSTSCASDDDCAAGGWCSGTSCLPRSADGEPCTEARACRSGLCVDGVCCNAPCSGQCEACDVSGAEGICLPVSGAPHGDRPPCDSAPEAEPCAAKSCDGIERSSCTGWVGTETVCRPGSCADGTAILEATCDGYGECPPEQTADCSPFACQGLACAATCQSDEQCAVGASCNTTTSECFHGATCLDEHTFRAANGETTDCSPYRCTSEGCPTACVSAFDCLPPNVCGSEQSCVPPDDGAEDAGGCTLAGRGAPWAPRTPRVLAWLLLLGIVRRRRGRKPRTRRWRGRATRAALGIACGCLLCACGSDGPSRRKLDSTREAERPGAELDSEAEARLTALRALFPEPSSKRGSRQQRAQASASLSQQVIRRAGKQRAARALAPGAIERLVPLPDGRLRPELGKAAAGCESASVTLPRRASGQMTLRNDLTGMTVGVALPESADRDLQLLDGLVLSVGAGPHGADLIYRLRADAVEDFLVFERRPARERIRYRLDVSQVLGLRLVSNVLELLDGSGTPRLRMNAPYLVAADGSVHGVRVSTDCRVDRDPRGPWQRPITKPGRSVCEVQLDWSGTNAAYPLLLDPVWTLTDSMATARYAHTSWTLQNGRVLVAGGRDSSTLASAELYDPSTNTWSPTGDMTVARFRIPGVLLQDGRALIAGGGTSETYDVATGLWTATQDMTSVRSTHVLALLHDGRALAAGGFSLSSAELFDPTNDTWSPTGDMSVERHSKPTLTVLTSGLALVVGGFGGGSYQSLTELYDPSTGTWTPTGHLHIERGQHGAVLLQSGQVLVSGGLQNLQISNCEMYDPVAGQWRFVERMTIPRDDHSVTLLPNGLVLVAGGETADAPWYSDTAELFDPSTETWLPIGSMATQREQHSANLLADGSVLVAGGYSDDHGRQSAAELFAFETAGGACSYAIECLSGHCVEGVCCDTACDAPCVACTAAKKGSGGDGICGPVAAATDPDGDCSDEGADSCGSTGTCSGTGACELYAAGTSCGALECIAGSMASYACNGAGACVQSLTSCAPYVCATDAACGAACASDADCASGFWCELPGGTCVGAQSNGGVCSSPLQCQSGYCVDGFCCDTACVGSCLACSAALKGSGSDGTCGPVAAGTDPGDDCPVDGAPSCQRDGECNGSGACRLYASGTACAPTACLDNAPNEFVCNGSGACLGTPLDSCGLYACEGAACKTTCASSADCAIGAWCEGSECQALLSVGDPCQASASCASGFCADGFCCDAACSGQCEACDVSGAEGLCVPVHGLPHGSRPSCPAAAPDDPCSEALCDGVERSQCTGFVGSAVTCREASCQDGVMTLAATCNGQGSCSEEVTKSCAPYVCGADSCLSECDGDEDCSSGTCQGGLCAKPAICRDDTTLEASDGQLVECDPYRCVDGQCGASCSSVLDCAPGLVCDDQGICVAPSAGPDTEDAGGCALGRRSRPTGGGWWALALGLVAASRRKRRWRCPPFRSDGAG